MPTKTNSNRKALKGRRRLVLGGLVLSLALVPTGHLAALVQAADDGARAAYVETVSFAQTVRLLYEIRTRLSDEPAVTRPAAPSPSWQEGAQVCQASLNQAECQTLSSDPQSCS